MRSVKPRLALPDRWEAILPIAGPLAALVIMLMILVI
jgi:hypothetical protein